MREIFLEETSVQDNKQKSKTLFYIFFTLSVICFAVGVIFVFVFITTFDFEKADLIFSLSYVIPLVLSFALALIFYFVKNKFYKDYDYSIVTGQVRISAVIKDVKRKQIIKFESNQILEIGRYNSNSFRKWAQLPKMKKMFLTANENPSEGKDFYYILVSDEGEKKIVILDCSVEFIKTILIYTGRNVLEKELR